MAKFSFVKLKWIINANTLQPSCSEIILRILEMTEHRKTAFGSPPWCPLQVVSCVSLQRERQWWSQMWWDQRGWAQEAPLLPRSEWTNINSVTEKATSTKQHDVKETVLIGQCNNNTCLFRVLYNSHYVPNIANIQHWKKKV